MPSRRTVLTGASALGITTLAGCTGDPDVADYRIANKRQSTGAVWDDIELTGISSSVFSKSTVSAQITLVDGGELPHDAGLFRVSDQTEEERNVFPSFVFPAETSDETYDISLVAPTSRDRYRLDAYDRQAVTIDELHFTLSPE